MECPDCKDILVKEWDKDGRAMWRCSCIKVIPLPVLCIKCPSRDDCPQIKK